jgi:hypothetical protein
VDCSREKAKCQDLSLPCPRAAQTAPLHAAAQAY